MQLSNPIRIDLSKKSSAEAEKFLVALLQAEKVVSKSGLKVSVKILKKKTARK